MKQTHTRGFTLIELLVVIAIIGILASVVLASLNTARDKGSDAAVKADLSGVRSQFALFYDNGGNTYTGGCSDTNVSAALSGAQTAVAGTPTVGGLGDGECVATDTEWAVWVNLKSASTSAFCVDSVGTSAEIVAQDSSAVDLTVCP